MLAEERKMETGEMGASLYLACPGIGAGGLPWYEGRLAGSFGACEATAWSVVGDDMHACFCPYLVILLCTQWTGSHECSSLNGWMWRVAFEVGA